MTTIQKVARAIADELANKWRSAEWQWEAERYGPRTGPKGPVYCADDLESIGVAAIERTFGPIVSALELIAEHTRDKGAAELAKHALAQLAGDAQPVYDHTKPHPAQSVQPDKGKQP
jgi:hypothetical protein